MKSVLITRPEPQASAFAAELPEGWQPVISPLLEIVPTGEVPDLAGIGGVIFTSVNGVKAAQNHVQGASIPAWCVGERTAEAARELGLDVIVADGDAAALRQLIAMRRPDVRLLHIRGKHSAGNLAQTLRGDGFEVDEAILYDQKARHLTVAAKAGLMDREIAAVALFSPRTARIFAAETQGIDLNGVRLLCLSRNVAEALGNRPDTSVEIAKSPDRTAMLALIAL